MTCQDAKDTATILNDLENYLYSTRKNLKLTIEILSDPNIHMNILQRQLEIAQRQIINAHLSVQDSLHYFTVMS